MKQCKECSQSFPIEAFPKAGNKGTGRRARCGPCHYQRENALRLQQAVERGAPYKPRVKPDPASGERLCRACEQTKPVDQFAKGQRECRACKSTRNARYRIEHADKEADRHARYYSENREVLLPKHRALRRRAYYADPEGQRAARRAYWNGLSREEQRALLVAWKESRYRNAGVRRARLVGTTLEPVNRSVVIARDHRTCYLCGRAELSDQQIHLDHVVPLSRGGTHTYDNIRVACRSCNYRKSHRLLSELDLSQFGRVS